MRSPAIPHFEIGASMPVGLRAKTRTEAQRDLDAHQATYPGPYRIKEACDSKHNEAWRRWAARKCDLVNAVAVASAVESSPAAKPAKPKAEPKPATVAKGGVAYYAEMVAQRVMEMVGMVPGSVEWRVARASALNYRGKVYGRATVEGITAPELPAIPNLPLELHRPKAAIQFHDARHVAEHERKRRMAERKRAGAA